MDERQLLNVNSILTGERQGFLVTPDGLHYVGLFSSLQIRRAVNKDSLTHTMGGKKKKVKTRIVSEDYTLSGAIRALTNEGISRMQTGGTAPTIEDYTTLSRFPLNGELFYDDRDKNAPAEVRFPLTGLPQLFDDTFFPKPDTVAAVAAGTATIAADDYYVWVMPYWRDKDSIHGPSDTDFTVANWANLIRSVDYVAGQPVAATGNPVTLNGSQGLGVSWNAPAIPDKTAQPDGFLVVVGTANDITDSASKVAAIVPWSTGACSADILTLGSGALGTAPAIEDFLVYSTASVSSGQRVYTKRTRGTDWEVDLVAGTAKRKKTGAIVAGEYGRLDIWFRQPETVKHSFGESTTAEKFEFLRLISVSPSEADPDTSQPEGEIHDLKINVAALAGDLLTAAQGEDGFHGPLAFSDIEIDTDSAEGRSLLLSILSPDNSGHIDSYSASIDPARSA